MKNVYNISFIERGHGVHSFPVTHVCAKNCSSLREVVVKMVQKGSSGGLKGTHYMKR